MHILLHIPYGVIGGAETHIKYLVKFLPPGVRASISCEYRETMDFANSVCPGQVYHTPSANTLYKLMEKIRPDIIQFYHSPTVYVALKKMHNRPRAIEVIHNRHHFGGDATSYPKTHTDLVIGVSPDAADYFMMSCPGVETIVIPNGIDHTVFFPPKKMPKRTGSLVGGFTGRLETDGGKGIREILDVARLCPTTRFRLVGLDYGGHFAKHVKENRLTNVNVLPYTDKVTEQYHDWDFFISMSPSEGFGISIAEAMACGLPCIVRRCGGICHYLENGKHAFLVDSALEAADIIEDSIVGHQLNPTSLDFSARTMALRYVDAYRKVLGTPRKSRSLQEETATLVLPKKETARGVRSSSRGTVLGISPPSWYGIRRAMTSLCDQWCSPEQAIGVMQKMKPSVVVFGSYSPTLDHIRQSAERSGAATVLTWHGTHLFNEFSEGDRRLMAHILRLAKDEVFDFVATPHEGTAKTWTAMGVPTDYLPNLLDTSTGVIRERPGGPHIGIMGTGFPWKNMETQILGANLVQGSTTHVQAMHADMVLSSLGAKFRRAPTVWGKEYLNFMGSMSVNLSVGITETFGYYAAESMLCGTPAITSPMVAFMRDAPEVVRGCVVNEIDNAFAIKEAVEYALANKKEVSTAARKFIAEMNEVNKEVVSAVKQKWLSN